ncbi:LysE family translocator [Moheibacter sediminis]|uniref:Threonine/homoserine/homoserine lactone efflux protein n=1 Tax=Moheibacter sediminis TaxID=1434700 RepID=A0A1W1Y817_9FLAO|nr:LysE family transporter [Moheibacter sediminis]SMC31961.1 Threonine/homoserine/homoserine lactone efflux protein [Moheibacter sediminis]
MEMVSSAILIGFILSLVLIGPVFFMLLETSVSRGWKAAITLNLGVITADVLCIFIAYFGSKDLALAIQNNPSIYIFGGFFILIYGLIMYITKPNFKMRNVNVVTRNYFRTFMNGFLLNILNIGVIVFWFFIVSTVVIQYPKTEDTFLYMGIVLATFFSIDLGKIFLAQKVKDSFTMRRIFYLKKTIGFILIIFGIIVVLKGFGVFEQIDRQIENKLPI